LSAALRPLSIDHGLHVMKNKDIDGQEPESRISAASLRTVTSPIR
jgi:hypothetical protein